MLRQAALLATAALLLAPVAVAVPPTWPRYVDTRDGFELQLPPGWKTGTAFLTTHAYAVLRRRNPSAARGYAAMLRAAPRHGVLLIAVDSSTTSLEHALRSDGGGYGLFPTIFIVRGSRSGVLPLGVSDFVVPVDWSGGTPTPATDCRRKLVPPQIICTSVYRTYLGDVYVDFQPVARPPAGRAPLVAGFVRAPVLEPNGGMLADPATPVWVAVRAIIRYR